GQGRDGQGFDLATTIIRMVVDPFRDFTRRRGWLVLLIFVVLFKLGDAMAGHMALPFYVELGFSKIEIANVSKLIGVAAAMVGVALGGTIVYRLGVMRALILCGVLQMTSDLLYIVQNWAGHQVGVLAVTISVENIAGGMGSAAFVAYLSGLCSRAYTATQYALLSALALVGRNVFASISGLLAQGLGWPAFFAVATALALPGLAMLIWIGRRPEFGTPAVPEGAGTA
ncbi:MAG TPA: MFS transporter, partial [Stellaceae bacterium]|nr:MFS transporter [Stellaceae bacterium]